MCYPGYQSLKKINKRRKKNLSFFFHYFFEAPVPRICMYVSTSIMYLPQYNLFDNTRDLTKSLVENTIDRKHVIISFFETNIQLLYE